MSLAEVNSPSCEGLRAKKNGAPQGAVDRDGELK
jgi:hypothetical protein